MAAGVNLGLALLGGGLVLASLVWLALKVRQNGALERSRRGNVAPSAPDTSDEGIVVVEPGGRVDFLNARARSWFEFSPEDQPHLDRLLRRIRPSEDFLYVCAQPGHRRLNLNGRAVEAVSARVPGSHPRMLVSLRSLEYSPDGSGGTPASSAVVRIISDFSGAITAHLDLQSVIAAILDNALRLIPADILELKVFNQATSQFSTYRLVEANGRLSHAAATDATQFGDLSARLLSAREAVLLADAAAVSAEAGGYATGLVSYLGIPLVAGDELVGALEAGQTAGKRFTTQEYELLRLLAPQISTALRNSILFEQERRRALEFSGLAGVAQAIGLIREPRELFARLVDAVAPLFDARIIGFLLFDETRGRLEGQVPFRGLPPHIVEIYRVPVAVGSPAEALIRSQRVLVTENAGADADWHALGLTDFATAASLRDTVLIPLATPKTMLGYLQISHRESGAPFSDSERHLAQTVADQLAAIIENASLVLESRKEATRSEALRELNAAAASAETVDDVLKLGLQKLKGLFGSEIAVVSLFDEAHGELRLDRPSAIGIPPEVGGATASVVVEDAEFIRTATGARQPVSSNRVPLDPDLPQYYRRLFAGFPLESFVAVPLMARGRPLGEVILGSRSADAFSDFDVQVLATAGAGVASALDRFRLASQTDESLRRRVDQLTSIARVSRELGAVRPIDELLHVIQAETVQATSADCGSILLLDPENSVSDPRRLQSAGCPFGPELTPLEQRSLTQQHAFRIPDFDASSELRRPHDGVRSAMFVPVTHAGKAIGLMQLHAGAPDAFDEGALETAQTLAAQAGAALASAQRIHDERRQSELFQRRAATVEKFSAASYGLDPELPLEEALTFVAQAIHDSTPFRVVLISVYEPETGLVRRVAGAGIEPGTLAELRARKQPLGTLRQLTQPEFRVSNSYYIPANQTPVLPADIHYVYATQYSEAEVKQNAWDPDDFLLLPLDDKDGNPLGIISLDDPANGLRPDRATIESVELFAGQVAQIIVSARRVGEFNDRIESLSAGLSRQQQLLSVTQNDLPVLLRKDLEQTMALHALERRGQRVRAGLAITESVSRQLDSTSALLALGRETLTQFGMSAALVAENTPEGPRLLHVLGNLPSSLNIEALFGQRNPLRSSLQTGVPILVQNLEESEEWRETPLLGNLRAKGVVSLPVLIDNQPVAAMMALSSDPLPVLTDEDRQVYIQISRQASVVLQNISLLNETRRRLHEVNILLEFSRQLGGMDPGQIVEALLESARNALSAAHAGAVLLWNDQAQILEPRAASGYADDESMLRITYQSGEALPGLAFASATPRRVDEIDFARDYALSPADLGLYRRGTGGRLPVSSMLLPIVVEDKAIGLLILDNFNTVGAFRPGDEALLLSLSQQAALSLENVRLVFALRERAGQLQGLNEVSAVLAQSLRSDQLVAALLDEVGRILPFDTATLWMRDANQLTVASARGFADSEKRVGLSVATADSALFQEMIAGGQPLYVPDVRADDRFPRLEAPRLSWLGVPLLVKGRLTGLIALEKWQAASYTDDQIQLGATLASQAAVALENASLYESSVSHAAELDERSQRLALLNRFSASLAGLLDADQIISLTSDQMRAALHADRVAAVSFDGPKPTWVQSSPPSPQTLPQILPNAPLFARLRDSLGVFLTDQAETEAELTPLRSLIGRDARAVMALPLAAGQQLLALLFATIVRDTKFSAAELELARTIANQASLALQNARSYQSTLRTAEQLSLLNQSSAELGTSLDQEDIYESIRRATARLMPVDAFVISLLDPERPVIDAVYLMDRNHRLPGRRAAVGKGLGSKLITSGEGRLLTDPQSIVDLDGGSLGDGPPALSGVAVPMTVGNQVVGMLSARSHTANAYTQEDLRLLSTLANQAVATIQNGRLFAETQRLAQEFEQRVVDRTGELRREQQNTETLLRILTEVSSSLDLDRALNRTLALLNEAARGDQGTIMLLNPDDDLLHYRAGFGYVSDRTSKAARGMTLRVGEGLAGWVVKNREAALVDDLRKDPRWVSATRSSREHRSAIVAPLMVADDVIGVLMVFSRSESYFSGESLTLVKAIANQVAVAINNARLYELIRDQAERLGLMLRNQQEEATRSQAILESVADGVLVTSAENHVSFVNASIQQILGPAAGEFVGKPLDKFSKLFGDPGQAWAAAIRRWADAPSLYASGDTYAERVELEHGRIALIHLAPVILENDFLGTVSILRDITHEVEVDRLKSEFVATVSHELRTPMTAIKGYIEMLIMGAVGAVNENQAHFLDIVRNNIDRLNTLVGDLLDVSRIESGKVTLAPEALDLRALAEDVLAEVRTKADADKKPMVFGLEAPKGLPMVRADPERIRQVLRTLVDNAYHYTPENGAVTVTLRADQRGSEIQGEVADNGIGISRPDQARVFERFFRGEHQLILATPGTGLGLSIARQLVEMHGGTIRVESDGIEGKGSKFAFTLPMKASRAAPSSESPAGRAPRKQAPRPKTRATARTK